MAVIVWQPFWTDVMKKRFELCMALNFTRKHLETCKKKYKPPIYEKDNQDSSYDDNNNYKSNSNKDRTNMAAMLNIIKSSWPRNVNSSNFN